MKTTGTKPDITILYEDNHLLIVHKPKGVLSQADHTGQTDILTLCKEYLKKEHRKPGNVFLGLLHRLDKPVSGIMMIAKTSKAASRISEQIRERTMNKSYLAVVEGNPPENGFLTHYLIKDSASNRVRAVKGSVKGAKQAQMMFRKMEQQGELALLKIKLITGRPHQIRIQLSEEQFPIWGDRKYGTGNQPTIALHAYELSFMHPTLKNEMVFNCKPLPELPWKHFTFIEEV